MEEKINLILIGDNQTILKSQESILSYLKDIKVKIVCSKTITHSISEYIQHEDSIVIINLTNNSLKELQFLNDLEEKNASIIIIGDRQNVDLLSQAIRAGVKDFIDYKEYEDKLDATFCNVRKNIKHINKKNHIRRLNTLINAKGGSGSSFIASNIAYILAKESDSRVALVDLDLQFGTVGLNFDKAPKYTIVEALNAIKDLDSVSLEAYVAKYNENLSLLLP